MHCCEKFFIYRALCGGCGITKVHFLGNLDDWLKLLNKTIALKEYTGKKFTIEYLEWVNGLEIVIKEFIETYKGNINLKFWNSVVDQYTALEPRYGSGGLEGYGKIQIVSGWLLNFFLHDKRNKILAKEFKTYHLYDESEEK